MHPTLQHTNTMHPTLQHTRIRCTPHCNKNKYVLQCGVQSPVTVSNSMHPTLQHIYVGRTLDTHPTLQHIRVCHTPMRDTPYYGVATISRLLKIIGLFCKRALLKRLYSAQETCYVKEFG